MIFNISILLSAIGAVVIAVQSDLSFLSAVGLGALWFMFFEVCCVAISLGLSMLLGRKDQFVLLDYQVDLITHLDADHIETSSGDYINTSLVKGTFYIDSDIEPVLVKNRYNIGGWRRDLLFELHEDEIEYLVYLPKNKPKD